VLRKPSTTPERISGALFDFAGFLTTMKEPVTFSASHDAGIAVELLEKWAEARGFELGDADVMGWNKGLGIQAMKEAIDDKGG
jgi:hypothetical protein